MWNRLIFRASQFATRTITGKWKQDAVLFVSVVQNKKTFVEAQHQMFSLCFLMYINKFISHNQLSEVDDYP